MRCRLLLHVSIQFNGDVYRQLVEKPRNQFNLRAVHHLREVLASGQLYRSIASGLTLRITSRRSHHLLRFFCRVSLLADCTEFLWLLTAAGNSDPKCLCGISAGSFDRLQERKVARGATKRPPLYFHCRWINSLLCQAENQSESIVLDS